MESSTSKPTDSSTNHTSYRGLDIRFVQPGNTDATKEKSARPPKAHHKKSRNGCQRCRMRRVKCDEVHPTCGNCRRYRETCDFEQNSSSGNDTESPTPCQGQAINNDEIRHAFGTASMRKLAPTKLHDGLGTIESSARRHLELKLMHMYSTQTSQSIVFGDDPIASDIWTHKVPMLALANDALLYSILSFTALHLMELDPPCTSEMTFIHRDYWGMALQKHQKDTKNLCSENFDAVCMTSTFIRLTAFVTLRDRSLVPYTTPTDWFQTIRGAMQVFVTASRWWFHTINDQDPSLTSRLTGRMPFVFDEEAKFGTSNRQDFLYLLQHVKNEDRVSGKAELSEKDQSVYEKTVSYIGGIWMAMRGHGPESSIWGELVRRSCLLPHLVPHRFFELVEEQCPRALVILAHYFAILSKFRHIWWIGNIGGREVRAMTAAVPAGWQWMMKWPLDIVTDQI